MNEFQTTHLFKVGAAWAMGAFLNNAQFGFPWDQYHVTTSFIAVNHESNATLPIVAIVPSEAAGGLFTDYSTYHTKSYFNGTADIPGQSVFFMLRRTFVVKTFVMTIFLVNWMLVAMIMFITVVAFCGKRQMPEGLLLLPVTIILTVPSLRALMVDSPAFGELTTDY
jgi:hypothetical protein